MSEQYDPSYVYQGRQFYIDRIEQDPPMHFAFEIRPAPDGVRAGWSQGPFWSREAAEKAVRALVGKESEG